LEACTIFAGVLFLCGLVFAQSKASGSRSFSDFRPRKEMPGETFVGSQTCARCHAERTRSQTQAAMAGALKTPLESGILRTHPRMAFQAAGYSHEILSNGRQSVYRVSDGKETLSEPILYAFGNAHVAQTYVFRHNGRLREGRVSYYRAIDGLDWTIGDALNPPPSLEEAAGRDIDGDEARNCFSCHGTAAVAGGALDLDHLSPGVGCEACHGPGAKHALAMLLKTGATDTIFNPRVLDAETLSQEFCGACHRGVDQVGMMPDLGGLSNVRFQPYRLFNSRGHDPTNAHFACTACHDPHEELRHEVNSYDAHCTGCHAATRTSANVADLRRNARQGKTGMVSARPRSCPVASERCVSCHMPKVEIPGVHFQFTDHRIRIARPGEPYPY
jgi:Cytochrome c554 and c-prime